MNLRLLQGIVLFELFSCSVRDLEGGYLIISTYFMGFIGNCFLRGMKKIYDLSETGCFIFAGVPFAVYNWEC